MKNTLLLILLLTIFSCDIGKKGINVSIENSTKNSLKNVKVSASTECFIVFDSIAPNDKATKFLDMSKVPAMDGGFMIQFIRPNGEEVSQATGYYSNGSPLNSSICFNVGEMAIFTLYDQFCD